MTRFKFGLGLAIILSAAYLIFQGPFLAYSTTYLIFALMYEITNKK